MLLHGFPELSYSWRNILVPLARQGYYVVAPDGRGFGRTKPRNPVTPGGNRPVAFEDDLHPYRMLNLVHDVVALIFALGYTSVASLIGHDFGSTLTGYCAVARPDLFRSVILMSAPFAGAPALPFATDSAPDAPAAQPTPPWVLDQFVDGALAKLDPPRKHYTHYFSGPTANADIMGAPQGLHAFLRSYFHMKSADWEANDPQPLPLPPNPVSLARLPHYYVMPRDASMADVVREGAPSAEEVQAKSAKWLPDNVLGVYVSEYGRTGFQGGLNKYRGMISESTAEELSLFSGRKVEVPAMYLSGRKDWGVFQYPGALDKMRTEEFTRMAEEDVVLLDGAGHWVQQERPEDVVKQIQRFLTKSL
ncbi:alpha/beta-hydrolase [Lentinus tigrinus ALCF2SS1-6]|uniref:Alpha/beta-hydrolase n=1 Tax=Lentinus tigrinus ALCF2SS1-6 TaxID=1328759 RepID=A0A5C2SE83_9APHY|nr:alpha/beta-hydrolase [Lentinus tigrinus ALCF2SS1-6]